MENKIPNDKLEDFLKKSFEGYTESPPDGLWGKIKDGLEPAPTARPLAGRNWWIAAAAVAVLAVFLCQHFYFENKIDRLTKTLQENAADRHGPATMDDQEAGDFQNRPTENDQATPTENRPQASVAPSGTMPGFSGETTPGPTETMGGRHDVFSKKENTPKSRDIAEISDNEEVVPIKNQMNGPYPTPAQVVATDVPQPAAAPGPAEQLAGPSRLAMLPFMVHPGHSATPTANFFPPTTAPAAQQRFTAGLRAMPMATRERITRVRPERFPQRPGLPAKYFNNQHEVTGQAFAFGATLAYRTGNHFSLVSGLDFRRTEITSQHRSEFAFKERRQPAPGQNSRRHEFTYNLNTSSGPVEVAVRAEASDTTRPVPDNEVLAFEVNTSHVTSHVSIPLAAKYSIGQGRLHGYLKGGVAVNFLLDNTFEITAVRSLNGQFRAEPVRRVKRNPQNLKSVTFHYLAAIDLEYDLTRSLSLSVEPTLMGSLGSHHSSDFIQSSSILAGVSVGASYRF